MTKKKDEEINEHHNDNGANRLMTGDTGSLYSSEWFGAIIRYLAFIGTRKFNYFYNDNPRNFWLNALVGWLFKLLILVAIVWLMFSLSNS